MVFNFIYLLMLPKFISLASISSLEFLTQYIQLIQHFHLDF